MVWEIEGRDQFADRFGPLSSADKVRIEAAIERLEEEDPGLGRPWVDSLVGTKVKELRPRCGYLRRTGPGAHLGADGSSPTTKAGCRRSPYALVNRGAALRPSRPFVTAYSG